MARENRYGKLRAEMSATLGLAQKLQALMDENLYLERHLAAMAQSNRVLQSMRSKKCGFKFKMVPG